MRVGSIVAGVFALGVAALLVLMLMGTDENSSDGAQPSTPTQSPELSENAAAADASAPQTTVQLMSSDGVDLTQRAESNDFAQHVQQLLLNDPQFLGGDEAQRADLLNDGGLVVETTLHFASQMVASTEGQELLDQAGVDRSIAYAMVSIEPSTGAVRVMMDSWTGTDPETENLVTSLRREPSGVFKGLTFAMAMEAGFLPSDIVDGRSPCGPPDNTFDNFSSSPGSIGTIIEQATSSSECAAWQLGQLIGPAELERIAMALGIQSPLPLDAGLAVGQVQVSPLEITSAYATLVNNGVTTDPYVIERILAPDDEVLYQHAASPVRRAMSVPASCRATEMLAAVEARSQLLFRYWIDSPPVAGKSGGDDDAWFVGFTPQLATGVWIGNPTEPMEFLGRDGRVYGAVLPPQLFAPVNETYHRQLDEVPFPTCAAAERDPTTYPRVDAEWHELELTGPSPDTEGEAGNGL